MPKCIYYEHRRKKTVHVNWRRKNHLVKKPYSCSSAKVWCFSVCVCVCENQLLACTVVGLVNKPCTYIRSLLFRNRFAIHRHNHRTAVNQTNNSSPFDFLRTQMSADRHETHETVSICIAADEGIRKFRWELQAKCCHRRHIIDIVVNLLDFEA